ncbi:MAG: hypothetical protein RhofKO_22480 [Rhodothermales bacterium]
MITLYRQSDLPLADEVEATLQDLVLAHEVVADADLADLPEGTTLPAVRDGRYVYHTKAGLQAYLDALSSEVVQGRKMQGDACFLDPEHPGVCALPL